MTIDAAAVVVACLVSGALFQSAVVLGTALAQSREARDSHAQALICMLLAISVFIPIGLSLAGLSVRFWPAAGGIVAGATAIEVPWLISNMQAARSGNVGRTSVFANVALPGRAAWWRWLAPAGAALVVAVIVIGATILVGDAGHRSEPLSPEAVRGEAATWVATQVSRAEIVACDARMCRALEARGFPPGDLSPLSGDSDLLDTAVVVATAAVRKIFGARLSSVFAPAILASFGSGAARIDVRVIAAEGPAAYKTQLKNDIAARRKAGDQVLHVREVSASASARLQLMTGQVDSRLMIIISEIAAQRLQIYLRSFGDSGPRASPGQSLRSVSLAQPAEAALTSPVNLIHVLQKFLRGQEPPYRPARLNSRRLPDGQPVLSIEFPAPSPLGLLSNVALPPKSR